MNRWEHLAQVPEDIRQTMSKAFVLWEKQDTSIEGVVDGMIQAPHVTLMTCRALRSAANAFRIPNLCTTVKTAHPELSWRDVFKAVGLFTGIHDHHVQRLYYARAKMLNCA